MSTQRVPDLIRRFSVLIALFWLGLAVRDECFRAAVGDRCRIAQRVA